RRMAVVIANVKGTFEIWFADRDAPSLRRAVAIADADCTNPTWAPDGSHLAFDRFSSGPGDGVYVVRAGSGEPPTRIVLGAKKRPLCKLFPGPRTAGRCSSGAGTSGTATLSRSR